ncbi:MAG: hypothetical protein ACNFW9_05725 [Candidatus Kerfeldbacteria bacterium]|jgi:ABC-type transport system involved in multi-copper enzyme maturation permease subunit
MNLGTTNIIFIIILSLLSIVLVIYIAYLFFRVKKDDNNNQKTLYRFLNYKQVITIVVIVLLAFTITKVSKSWENFILPFYLLIILIILGVIVIPKLSNKK